MNRDAWVIFFGLLVAGALALLGHRAWEQHQELRFAQNELLQARAATSNEVTRLAELEQQLTEARERATALALAVAEATNTHQRLETEMRAAIQSRDVAISELHGKLTVSILDRILFDSGEANLKPEGMQVLQQVAGVLAGFTNRQVQVLGHTDNVPIRVRYASNWELSTARAVAAVRFLSEKAGVDPRRLSAVGCGEFQPVADNATADGRARNRRIALVVLPEQFIASDVSGATNTNSNSNAAPAAPGIISTPEIPPTPKPAHGPATNGVTPGEALDTERPVLTEPAAEPRA